MVLNIGLAREPEPEKSPNWQLPNISPIFVGRIWLRAGWDATDIFGSVFFPILPFQRNWRDCDFDFTWATPPLKSLTKKYWPAQLQCLLAVFARQTQPPPGATFSSWLEFNSIKQAKAALKNVNSYRKLLFSLFFFFPWMTLNEMDCRKNNHKKIELEIFTIFFLG